MNVLGLDDEAEALVRAWNAWEGQPGLPRTAEAMEAAVRPIAERLGVTTNVLRIDLAARRRQGLGPETVVRDVLGLPHAP